MDNITREIKGHCDYIKTGGRGKWAIEFLQREYREVFTCLRGLTDEELKSDTGTSLMNDFVMITETLALIHAIPDIPKKDRR